MYERCYILTATYIYDESKINSVHRIIKLFKKTKNIFSVVSDKNAGVTTSQNEGKLI